VPSLQFSLLQVKRQALPVQRLTKPESVLTFLFFIFILMALQQKYFFLKKKKEKKELIVVGEVGL